MHKKFLTSIVLLFFFIIQIILPTNIAQAATNINLTLGTTVTGSISETNDENIYKIVLPKAGQIDINMSTAMSQVNVGLTDVSGSEVLSNTLSNGNEQTPTKWSQSVDLEAGTYYLKVSKYEYADVTGKYTLGVNFNAANNNDKEPNNGTLTAQQLNLNSNPITGYISWNDTQDVYKIVLPKAGKIDINMGTSIKYLDAALTDTSGNEIVSNTLSNGDEQTPAKWLQSVDLEAGTYYLKVSKYEYLDVTGKYTLGVNFNAANNNDKEPNNGTISAQQLNLNSNPIIGYISWNDAEDIYKIVLPKAGKIDINMSTSIKYLDAGLTDTSGNEIVSNTLSNGSEQTPTKWLQSVDLEAGTYYLKVSKYEYLDVTGKYTLGVNFNAANSNDKEPNNGTLTAQQLDLNSNPIAGYISWNDTQDIYKFVLPKAGKIDINMSTSIKYLDAALTDTSGNEIVSNTLSNGSEQTPTKWLQSVDLEAGTYYLKVSKYEYLDVTGKYTIGVNCAAMAPPSIPTSIKATSSSYNSVNTSWNTATGANGYEVYRATSSAGSYALISTTTAKNYNNTGLATNSNYYYKVRAYKMVGTVKVYSGYSTVISARPIPSAPTSVNASSSYNSIKTSWSAVTGANGYEVYRASAIGNSYGLISTTNVTNYNNTGLATNSDYFYKIRAYRMVGSTKVYSSFSAVIGAKLIPVIPTNFKANSSSYNSINISWGSVARVNGYEVYRATSSGSSYTLMSTTTGTGYNNTGLSTNSRYYYKVRAYRMDGAAKIYSGYSAVISSRPVMSVPTALKVTSSSYNSINTSWSGVNGANGYEVLRATSGAGSYKVIFTTTAKNYNNTGLATNSTYYYKVRAYRMVGKLKVYSDLSSLISSKPVPAVPLSVKAVSSSYNSVNSTWATVTGAGGYEVYRATTSSGIYNVLAATTAKNYNNTGLTTNKIYYYKVRAYRMVGKVKVYGNWSSVVNSKPVPSTPSNVKSIKTSSKSIKITWSKTSGASGYEIYKATSSSGSYSIISRITGLYYTNSKLIAGRTYYYKIRSYRTVGTTRVYSSMSSIVHAKA